MNETLRERLYEWWVELKNPKIRRCARETSHARYKDTPFCRCTRIMYSSFSIIGVEECRVRAATGTLEDWEVVE